MSCANSGEASDDSIPAQVRADRSEQRWQADRVPGGRAAPRVPVDQEVWLPHLGGVSSAQVGERSRPFGYLVATRIDGRTSSCLIHLITNFYLSYPILCTYITLTESYLAWSILI